MDDADVFVQQASGSSNHVPIPMGLEVFENVSKFVAHQIVAKEDGKLVFNLFARCLTLRELKTVARKSVNYLKNLQANQNGWRVETGLEPLTSFLRWMPTRVY